MRHIAIHEGAIHEGGLAELALATADRREWRVLIDLDTLSLLDGCAVRSDDDVGGLLIRHMAALKMAALRVVARGTDTDGTVRIETSDLRLPLAYAA